MASAPAVKKKVPDAFNASVLARISYVCSAVIEDALRVRSLLIGLRLT